MGEKVWVACNSVLLQEFGMQLYGDLDQGGFGRAGEEGMEGRRVGNILFWVAA